MVLFRQNYRSRRPTSWSDRRLAPSSLFQRRLNDIFRADNALHQRFGRCFVENQRAAGGQFTVENGVLHFFDVDAFGAQFAQNVGQHADAIIVADDERHAVVQLARIDRIDGLAGFQKGLRHADRLLGDGFLGLVGRGADVR